MAKLFTSGYYKYLIPALLTGSLFLAGKTAFIQQPAGAQPPHIVFIEDAWGEALKQAKIHHKYIFVDAYASWCGPCKMLKAKTFTDDKAAAFFNSNFINISIDMEKGVGPQLAAQWGLQAYPTLIIFNPSGKPVLGSVGYINAAQLMQFGTQALLKK